MILEAVILNIKPGLEDDFEFAFKQASSIISSMDGYLSHELHRCMVRIQAAEKGISEG